MLIMDQELRDLIESYRDARVRERLMRNHTIANDMVTRLIPEDVNEAQSQDIVLGMLRKRRERVRSWDDPAKAVEEALEELVRHLDQMAEETC